MSGKKAPKLVAAGAKAEPEEEWEDVSGSDDEAPKAVPAGKKKAAAAASLLGGAGAGADSDDSDGEQDDKDISDPDVLSKYKLAADLANRALLKVIAAAKAGARIVDLCAVGDRTITEGAATVFTKAKNMDKGIAFPTSISPNNIVGHLSPLSGDTATLAAGDLVKIDLGAQIDGYCAVVAHTILIPDAAAAAAGGAATASTASTATAAAAPAAEVSGRRADVICAVHYAAEAAHRLLRPGGKNTEISEALGKIAAAYKCSVVEGVLSHQMKRYVIDGNKVILSKPSLEQRVDEVTFEENEVWALDLVMSTGEGRSRETDAKTTIFKRAIDQSYQLKLKASRYVLNEINQKCATFPFSLRMLADETRGKLGITELVRHGLVNPYPVLYEKNGEFVAQIKFTALLTATGTSRLSLIPLPIAKSEHAISDPDILKVLQSSTKRGPAKPKKKKNKKKDGAAGAAAPAAAAAPVAAAPAAAAPAAAAPAEPKA